MVLTRVLDFAKRQNNQPTKHTNKNKNKIKNPETSANIKTSRKCVGRLHTVYTVHCTIYSIQGIKYIFERSRIHTKMIQQLQIN